MLKNTIDFYILWLRHYLSFLEKFHPLAAALITTILFVIWFLIWMTIANLLTKFILIRVIIDIWIFLTLILMIPALRAAFKRMR
jgi:hypothetical protein